MSLAPRQVVCAFPAAVRASELLAGSAADFVINAYLALQHQWPDRGGFDHYLRVLGQRPQARAEVLRAIAASPNAVALGVRFEDDLPPEHRHDESAPPTAAGELGTRLRLARAVADIATLQHSAGQLLPQAVHEAVQAIADAQLTRLGLLESRLAELTERLDAAMAPPPADRRRPARRPRDWRQLRARQLALEAEVIELRAQLGGAPGSAAAGAVLKQAVLAHVLAYFEAVPLATPSPEAPT
ncbi:MAG: DUF4214 domain-containing protein [Proteobacteria bacterium]|nr:DUF4214 domain-containing protein [Pseudomonadota bacterium]